MSRCLPFPTPAFASTESYQSALVELIKLQKEKEEAKRERKKEKKLKKKLMEEYKGREKRKPWCFGGDKVEKLEDENKYHRVEKSNSDLNEAYPKRIIDEDEAERLEKSDLTEEHEQPTCSQCVGYLSDSTQSSNKRKRHNNSANDRESQSTTCSSWLPLQKHREPDASLSNKQDKNCSKEAMKEQLYHTNANANVEFEPLTLKPCLEFQSQTPERTEARVGKKSCSYANKMKREDEVYRALFEKWVPDRLTRCNFGDDDWLFESKNRSPDWQGSKRRKANSWVGVTCSRSSTLWPRANFLSEVDIWALPYTISF